MNIDSKGFAVLIVVAAGAVALAYTLGIKEGEHSPPTTIPGTTEAALPANHPETAAGNAATGKAGSATFTHFQVGNRNVKGMYANGDEVWVGTSGGAIRYDLKKEDYKVYDVNNGSLISNGVFHVSKLGNNIMIGTYGGGLSAFDLTTQTWKNYNIPDGLADQFVYDIAVDPQGNYWIATWSGVNFVPGGNLSQPAGWKTYNIENTKGGLPNDWVYGVETGKNGDMWFATEGGLARLDKNLTWTHWQHEQGLGANYDDVKNDIEFTNDPAQASKHHAQQKAEQGMENVKVGYNPNYIVSMLVDDSGAVWCGTWGGGLSKFDGNQFVTYSVKDGLPGNHVFMLHKSTDGGIWIGTNRGLAKQAKDGKGFSVMTKADGLFADNVFSMAVAADGSLWVGSFGGVARILNPKI